MLRISSFRPRDLRLPTIAALALLLGACDSEPTGPVTPPGPQDLATDRQLATAEDPNAPPENELWVRWTRDNARPVRSLTAHRFDDLQFLKSLLAGKRIVQLGESSHGIREFNQAKVRLIRFLHEEMGYDVIAFESGLYECWETDRQAGVASARTTMRGCIFGVWNTAEVEELFEYIRLTKATARPLVLAGFDTQISSMGPQPEAARFLRDVVEKVDIPFANRVHEAETAFLAEYRALRAAQSPFGPAYQPLRRLIPVYDSLTAWVDQNAAPLASAHGGDGVRPAVARQFAWSRRQYIEQVSRSFGVEGTLARERGMAENLTQLVNRVYPGKKVIVWAHNAHIQHDRAHIIPGNGSDPGDLGEWNSMGHFVMQRHRAELYTVGFFMYRGTGANNDRSLYPVTAARPGSIESLGYRVRKRQFFLDLAGAGGRGSEWTGQTIPMKDWGVWDMIQVPRAQYDGIFFVDTVSPPAYF